MSEEDRRLSNSRCKCQGCGEYFNSVGVFDEHRRGKGEHRRCLTPGELSNRGVFQNDAGFWQNKNSNQWWKKQ